MRPHRFNGLFRHSLIFQLILGLGILKLCLASVIFFFGPLGTGSLMAARGIGEQDAGLQTGDLRNRKGKKVGKNKEDKLRINPEVLEILRAEYRRAAERNKELDKKEKDLELLNSEIEKRLKDLKQLQASLEGPVKKAKADYEARFQHLVGVYSSMDPGRAAALLDKLDEATVARIFAAMKSKKVARILALMDPEKAARISGSLSSIKGLK